MKKNSGFTLIEIIVVLAIVSIMYVAVISSYSGYKKRTVILNATNKLYADINNAVMEANLKKITARLVIDENKGYTLIYSAPLGPNPTPTPTPTKTAPVMKKPPPPPPPPPPTMTPWWGNPTPTPTPTPSNPDNPTQPVATLSPPPPTEPPVTVNQPYGENLALRAGLSIKLPNGANVIEIQPYTRNINSPSGTWSRNYIVFMNGASEVAKSGNIIITDGKFEGIINIDNFGKISIIK